MESFKEFVNIPTRTLQGKIRSILYTSNPITVIVDNGTVWKLTKEQWDYLGKIGRQPYKGKSVTIETFLDGKIKSIS